MERITRIIGALPVVIGFALVPASGCKKSVQAVDAGVRPRTVVEIEDVGLTLSLPAEWNIGDGADAGALAERRMDARRSFDRIASMGVAPRFVVSVERAASATNLEGLLDKNVAAFFRIESTKEIVLDRIAKNRRTIGGAEFGELRIDYRTAAPALPVTIVQRIWVTTRGRTDGEVDVVTLTATYVKEHEDVVDSEVMDIVNSLKIEPVQGSKS